MYYIDYIDYEGFATCSQLFWEPCWELFLVNKPVLPFGQYAFGQSAMKTTIDRIFSVDLAFGQSEV